MMLSQYFYQRHLRRIASVGWAAVTIACCCAADAKAVNYDEAIDGDLSNDRLAPTTLNLSLGTNSVIATMPGADLDFLTVVVPENHLFSGLTNVAYASTDGRAFIGMQAGTTMTVNPASPNAANLLGYTHFGTLDSTIGTDILDNIGQGPGSIGFLPPLLAGPYTFWIQQASSVGVSYQFDFIVTAAPVVNPPGDYNGDSLVDAADYTVWRDTLGQMGEDLAADGNGDEKVDAEDYEVWKNHFGQSAGGGAALEEGSAPVPEPASLWLAMPLALTACVALQRGQRGRCRAPRERVGC